jgi:formyl-CoA transferase
MTHDAGTGASGPLAGIRVLELGSFIAAPFAGRLLADFGADVVKVERPGAGDELRRWRLHDGDTSLLFRTMNRNKRSIALDLADQDDLQVVRDLVARADIVLENFRPGTLERRGLGPDDLKALNPKVILVRISGYGQTGPYRDRPGFGGVAEAIGGLRNLTGEPDRPPTRVGVSLADSVAGLHAVIGALLALRARDAVTGRGDVVDVALYEGIFALMESLIPDYDAFGIEPHRTGSALPGVAPSNTYLCGDGAYVVISGNGDAIFARLMSLIGREDLGCDPDLADNAGRSARAGELDAAIGGWAIERPHGQVLAELERAGVPSGPIFTAADIGKDPHYAARGMLESHEVRLDENRVVTARFPGVVPRLTEQPGQVRWLGPEFDQHGHQIRAELNEHD